MAPHAVLCEIGVPFELVRVDTAAGAQRDPAYLALNPNARVPTLVHGDRVIYESAAIVLYLCESHPQAGLMPLPGDADRPAFLQWLFWLTNTLQIEFLHWFHADHHADAEASRVDMKAVAERRLEILFRRLDAQLAEHGPYMLGERFSAIDYYLVMLCRWSRAMPKTARDYPHLNRLIDLVTARPAWAAMMKDEGITWTGTLQ